MPRFHEKVMGVYFDDLDPYQILHNAKYLLLFERVTGSFWMELGLGVLQDPEHPDRFHFVRANHVDYLSPVTGVGNVRVRVWIDRMGSSSLTFGFKMMPLDNDTTYAQGERTIVRIDPDTRKSTPWSTTFREALADWIEPTPA